MNRSVLACGLIAAALLGSSCSRNARDRRPGGNVAATDALWALAPADTVSGVVVAPGTGNLLAAAWAEIERIVGRWQPVREALAALRQEAPAEVFDAEARARMGIDIARGAALFLNAEQEGVLILPVVDRARLRQRAGLSTEQVDGTTLDVMGEYRCRDVAGHYACAKSPATLAVMGRSPALARRIAARPAALRGAIEVYLGVAAMDAAQRKELTDSFAGVTAIQIAVQLAPGVLTVRGYMDGRATDPIARDIWQVPATLSRRLAESRPGGVLQLRLPLFSISTASEVAAALRELGVDITAEDVARLTGEIVLTSASGDVFDVSLQVGARDGKRLQPLVARLCQAAQGLGLPITVNMKAERCTARILPTDLQMVGLPRSLAFERPLEIVLAAGDTALTARATMPDLAPARGTEVSALGRELVAEPWTMSLWGHGSVLRKLQAAPMAPIAALEHLDEPWKMSLWFLAHVTELGWGVAVREDGIYSVLHVGTHWANPDRVLRQYQALVDRMLAGDAGIVDDFAALAREHPGTPLGRAYASGPGGGLIVAATAGMAAAVAVPAVQRYRERSKEYQASLVQK